MTPSAPVDPPRGMKELVNAVARGRLQERPFPRLLHQVFGKRLTGCLEIIDDSGDQSRVYLRDGAPVHVDRPNDHDRLDQVLTEAGLVAAHVISDISVALPPGKRLGEVLIEKGLLTAGALADALKLQMRRKLLRLFFPRRGDFAIFLDAHNYGAGGEFREMRVDPRCLMFPGLRAAYDETRLRIELAPLVNHRFRLLPTLPTALLEAMGFRSDDPTVTALGNRAYTLGELPLPGTKGTDGLCVVLALLYTDLLEATPSTAAGGTTGAHQAVPRAPAATGITGTFPVPSLSQSGVFPAVTTQRQTASYLAVPRPGGDPGRQTGSFPAPGTSAGQSGSMPAIAGGGSGGGGFNPRQTGTFPAASISAGQSGSMPAIGGSSTSGGFNPRQTGTFPAATLSGGTGQTGTFPAVTMPPAGAPVVGAPTSQAAVISQRLDELLARLPTISHFELLGVGPNATADEVNNAYLQHMRQFHPDRLAATGQRDAADKAARVTAQMNEAHGVLSDARRRAEYIAARAAQAPGAPPPVDHGRAILSAEEAFQKGEQLMRKGDLARAAEAFAAAMKLSPLEPIYKAHWAFTRFETPGAPKDRLVRETLRVLEEVRRERPKFGLALLWMGLCHKFLGDMASAEAAFRTAVEKDKTLLEAERELRVIEMRRQKAPVAAPAAAATAEKTASSAARQGQKSIFGKFLKR